MINKDVRKLVSIKTIDTIKSIPNADFIELAVLGGWQVVVKKNEFNSGDKVIYFEIDSFLPNTVKEFQFLTDKSSRTVINPKSQEVTGHVLKTTRLRGELSQGLVLSTSQFGKDLTNSSQEEVLEFFENLGVFKYEKPLPIQGNIINKYPSHTVKTDSERVQNLTDEFLQSLKKQNKKFKATEKIDGMSTTWWKDEEGNLRVASRNFELDLHSDKLLLKIANTYKLFDVLQIGETLKGELYGEGIQGNPLKIQGKQLRIFDWESTNRELPEELKEIQVKTYDFEFPNSVEEALTQVDKLKSLENPNVQAEGIVWWILPKENYEELGYRSNFKAINNSYILKSKDN